MNFTLFYRGLLPANGKPRDKQVIRDCFHPQLKVLWDQPPLSRLKRWALSPDSPGTVNWDQLSPSERASSGNGEPSLIKDVAGIKFAPLVSSRINTVAALDITFLRPEAPGSIITSGGDMDNRLKTLFDALTVPNSDQIAAAKPAASDDLVFCVLEDDNLIVRLNVRTEQLLESTAEKNEIVALIRINTEGTQSVAEALVTI